MKLNFTNTSVATTMEAMHNKGYVMLVWGLNRFRAWRRAARDAQQLRAMSDRELADLGLGRGEIAARLAGEPQKPKKSPQGKPVGFENSAAERRRIGAGFTLEESA